MAIGLPQLRWLMKQLRAASTMQTAGRLATRAGSLARRYPAGAAGLITGATAGGALGVRKRNQRRWSRDLRSGIHVGEPTSVLKRYQRY